MRCECPGGRILSSHERRILYAVEHYCFRRNKAQEDFNSFAMAVEIFMPLRNTRIARGRLLACLVSNGAEVYHSSSHV